MKYSIVALMMVVAPVVHAEVRTTTSESTFANYMFNGCTAQREDISLNAAMKMINPDDGEKVAKIVRSGYLFGSEFPRVGCNQIFVTVIDELAGNK